MRPLLLAGIVLLATAVTAPAQIPVYHGVLDVEPAGGTFNTTTGMAVVKVRRWRLHLAAGSNGIFPDREPILLEIRDPLTDRATTLNLAAGMMKASANGKAFTYRAPHGTPPPAVRVFQLKLRKDGWYSVILTLTGVDLSPLLVQAPVCFSTTIIVGDDDGFSGVWYTRANFKTRRLRIPADCSAPWPRLS